MNNEATTQFNYISNLTANSSSAMADEFDFDYKFEKGLNEEVINRENEQNYRVLKKVIFDRFNGFLSIMFIPTNAIPKTNAVLNISSRLGDPLFGRDILNTWINDKAKNAPTIEKVREITAKLPSLTKLLLDDRNNE